jgi:uncharacterized phage protein gp47/JayE
MRTAEDINLSIRENFKKITGHKYRQGSALGFITDAVSREMEKAHLEIERNKNPHIYTNLYGEDLDKMGTFVNIPREAGEDDMTYLYRIMNWTYLKAGATNIAVNDSLLNLEYSSDAQYYPQIHGAGTGVIYIIPIKYEDDIMAKALAEVKDRVKNVLSPESYTEYIIPTAIPVNLICHLEVNGGDVAYIRDKITSAIKDYINGIAPNDYLSVGEMNRIGLAVDNVDFFSIDGVYLNGEYNTNTKILQELETKMLFQEISWED